MAPNKQSLFYADNNKENETTNVETSSIKSSRTNLESTEDTGNKEPIKFSSSAYSQMEGNNKLSNDVSIVNSYNILDKSLVRFPKSTVNDYNTRLLQAGMFKGISNNSETSYRHFIVAKSTRTSMETSSKIDCMSSAIFEPCYNDSKMLSTIGAKKLRRNGKRNDRLWEVLYLLHNRKYN